MSDPAAGLDAFLAALAAAGIAASRPAFEERHDATFPWPARPLAIVSPATTAEAARTVAIAGQTGQPIHPLSRGRNWGLGSRLPVVDAAILDLSRLDAILDIDMANGTARIEPGVTFSQLQARLKAEGLRYHLPSFGGPLDASVLANALERGDGAGPMGDRHAGLFDLDIALSTGERIRTGHGRFGAGISARLHGRPAGPLMEGLFSQSSLGVVLSGRIALNPTLDHSAALLVEIATEAALDLALPVLRRLIESGILHAYDVAIWNQAKRLSSLHLGRDALVPAMRDAGGWGLSLIVASDHRDVFEARIAAIRRSFESLASHIEMMEDRTDAGDRLETFLTGFSHGGNLASVYAAKSGPIGEPLDPDRDGCGFLWLCPVLPFSGEALREVEALLAEAVGPRAFFPALGAQAVSGRALHGYVSLAWDRADDEADRESLAVYGRVATALADRGYHAFRLAHPGLRPAGTDAGYGTVLRRLARALDPAGVIAPGRSVPAERDGA
ncbi:MAG TPA: FAD-binding oxidoreductase [Bosea sp. (in: a-proteobacteria)]|jgi:4-cresol dehydrogenase (hydroxylating)|uniref:FAD-binding oxidoreductase n=1 Tax=Bosea sp. (in: a-proteobacteria) TaxID=1871050 RepID=UPI002DDCC32A|nr:FAD-binding oxidoreductase [Bosea sp. (in: a-proteobacteria)]HEV2553515.1 FAD-binding oxidoreductase [Bosea sp. (in: a-proteobacteria)]